MQRREPPGIEVLADETRRRIVRLLNDHPHRPSAMAHQLGLHRSTITYHLRILEAAGLVRLMSIAVDDRSRLYSLERTAYKRISAWLEDTELDEPLAPMRSGWTPPPRSR
jgi:DNA-binding transcriptional ArsR family regulator